MTRAKRGPYKKDEDRLNVIVSVAVSRADMDAILELAGMNSSVSRVVRVAIRRYIREQTHKST